MINMLNHFHSNKILSRNSNKYLKQNILYWIIIVAWIFRFAGQLKALKLGSGAILK